MVDKIIVGDTAARIEGQDRWCRDFYDCVALCVPEES